MPYFTTAEFRTSMADMTSSTTYPDANVERARDWVEALIERVCGTSFIARTATQVLSGDGTRNLVVYAPYVLSVSAASVGGVALSAGDLTALVLRAGVIKRPIGSVWAFGFDNVSITYAGGYSATVPADLKEAAMYAVRWRVLGGTGTSGMVSERATSMTNEFGNVAFAVAGPDRPTGLPEVDAVIMGWAAKVDAFGFA